MKIDKEINSLESIITKLKEKALIFGQKIEDREDVFNGMSENWQDSGKGEAHQNKTDEMIDLINEISSEIDDIEYAVDNLKNLT